MLGDHLLVAPVVERGVRKRGVVLPAGRWFGWWTGSAHEGDTTLAVDAPLDVLPLFLRGGGIVPMLRPDIDTLSPTTDPARVECTQPTLTRSGCVSLHALGSEFELFDGAKLGQEEHAGGVRLTSSDGTEFTSGASFEVIGLGSRPARVTEQQAPLPELADLASLEAAHSGIIWDSAATGGTLYVRVPAGSHVVEIER